MIPEQVVLGKTVVVDPVLSSVDSAPTLENPLQKLGEKIQETAEEVKVAVTTAQAEAAVSKEEQPQEKLSWWETFVNAWNVVGEHREQRRLAEAREQQEKVFDFVASLAESWEKGEAY